MAVDWRAFWSGFAGKIVGALFIAACSVLGVGAEKWVTALMGTSAIGWVWLARAGFLALAIFVLWGVFIRPAFAGLKIIIPWHYRPEDTDWAPLRFIIPLEIASQRAYEKLRGRTLSSQRLPAKFADINFSDEQAKPISWFGLAILGRGSIPVFGIHPPSSLLEIVPKNLIEAAGHLSDNANSISYYGKSRSEYEKLFIKKSDFKKRLKEIESWHGDDT